MSAPTVHVHICTEATNLKNLAEVGTEMADLIQFTTNRIAQMAGVPQTRLLIRSVGPFSVTYGSIVVLGTTIVAEVV